ncbi:Alpha/Beta hydrolase protein [Scenedesmus sp. NREL 46B-D3]|nr:Alpha/Beta hydrolase protein [Scenedesmus sp. NREL 46B-D3]
MSCAAQWKIKVVHAVLAMLFMLRSASCAAASTAQYSTLQYTADYSSLGPCEVTEQPLETLLLPEASSCGNYCRLSPRLHLPLPPNSSTGSLNPSSSAVQADSTRCSTAPLPTVVFFSGFQLRSAYYTPYARWLASWGYACVQYDLAMFHIVPDEVEHQGPPGLSRIGTAGHSRGGKLAALHLADDPRVAAAFLVDPVDSGGHSSSAARGSLEAVADTGRSAVQALAGKHKQAAIAGAGVSGPCNPQQRSYHAFFEVLGAGSWLEVVPAGGHMQFASVTSSVIGRALDWLCHSGHTSHEHVIELAAPALIAWMEAQLRRKQPGPTSGPAGALLPVQSTHPAGNLATRHSIQAGRLRQLEVQDVLGLQAFFRWVNQEQLAGEITFDVKQVTLLQT